jgi:hypothetical protein
MGPIQPKKLALAILISFLSAMPLVVWVYLGATGQLSGFVDAKHQEDLTIALLIVTTVWYIGVTPFVIWPRIWNGTDARENLLKKGTPARGILLETGLKGKEGIKYQKRRNTCLVMAVKVILPDDSYEVRSHLALVPESILPFVREGMEFPVRVNPSDRMSIEIDWEPLLVHYPESTVISG